MWWKKTHSTLKSDGSSIEEEVLDVINHMKSGKVTGSDKISVEELEALDEYGVKIMTKLLNDICNAGHILTELLKSTFLALTKKPESVKTSEH